MTGAKQAIQGREESEERLETARSQRRVRSKSCMQAAASCSCRGREYAVGATL